MIPIWPGRRMARLWLVPALASLILLLDDTLEPFILALDATAVFVALLDLATLAGAKRFRVERRHAATGSLDEPFRIELLVSNLGSIDRRVVLKDDTPESFCTAPEMFELLVPARSTVALESSSIPRRRGTYQLERADLFVSSRWLLWKRSVRLVCPGALRIYPNIRQIARYTLLARRDHERVLGVRRLQRLGTDNEFERLRDYVTGDDPRRLDWRATARRGKLTSRAYQQNQSQHVLFLLDSGRLSAGDAGQGLAPLDLAMNAMLLLAHVALGRGDRVGLFAFSDRVRAYVAPTGGRHALGRLVHAVHDVFPEFVESRLDRAFLELEARCRKRSLVILFTAAIDETTAAAASLYLRNLKGRHLPLGVFLRDHSYYALADDPNRAGRRLYQSAAAASILTARENVINRLGREGVSTLDVFPEELTANLVNRYLEIKAKHLL